MLSLFANIFIAQKNCALLIKKYALQFVIFAGTTEPLGIRLDFDISFPSGL
jgi:hypothetical protein